LVAGIYGQTAREVIAQYPTSNLPLPQTGPYTKGIADLALYYMAVGAEFVAASPASRQSMSVR
jgi:hypothetical protein